MRLQQLSLGLVVLISAGATSLLFRSASVERPVVSVERLTPLSAGDNVVRAKPNERVRFVYQIRNRGRSEIAELQLNETCRCRVKSGIPKRLLPNESGTIELEFAAPRFGKVQQVVTVFAGAEKTPIARLEAALEVQAEVPSLFSGLRGIVGTKVRGDTEPVRFSVAALERMDRPAWLSGVEVISGEFHAKLDTQMIDTRREAGEGLCIRSYSVLVNPRELSVGVHRGSLQFRMSDGNSAVQNTSVPIELKILEPVELIPKQLTLRPLADGVLPSQDVTVINRTNKPFDMVADGFDSTLLSVKPNSSANSGQARRLTLSLLRPLAEDEPATITVQVRLKEIGDCVLPVTVVRND